MAFGPEKPSGILGNARQNTKVAVRKLMQEIKQIMNLAFTLSSFLKIEKSLKIMD